MAHPVYQKLVNDVDQLKQRLTEVWFDLQHLSIRRLTKKFLACSRVKGYPFEDLSYSMSDVAHCLLVF